MVPSIAEQLRERSRKQAEKFKIKKVAAAATAENKGRKLVEGILKSPSRDLGSPPNLNGENKKVKFMDDKDGRNKERAPQEKLLKDVDKANKVLVNVKVLTSTFNNLML